MPGSLPPAPIGEPPGSLAWQQWYIQLSQLYTATGAIPWDSIDTAGSDITDLASRAHNNLQSLQGGTSNEYYHNTAAQNTTMGVLRSGTGAPAAGLGSNGDFYFRTDGTVAGNTVMYHKEGGSWVAFTTT